MKNFKTAKWIAAEATLSKSGSQYAPNFINKFDLSKPVKSASASICGLGYFVMSINDKAADDSLLNPFPSQLDTRILYRTFDVSRLLKRGENTIKIELGNSFWNDPIHVWCWDEAEWRDVPKLLFCLEVEYVDGTTKNVVSDESWLCTTGGPTYANSVYYGDYYDNRKKLADALWQSAVLASTPSGKLCEQTKSPIKKVESFIAESVTELSAGVYLVKSPKMCSGWAKLSGINGAAGTKITLRYAQILEKDGTLKKYGAPDGALSDWYPDGYLQCDKYICDGTKNESFEPKYSPKGFLYIQIEGLSAPPKCSDIEIYRISNDVHTIGHFRCSNPMFNKLHQMMVDSCIDNYHGEHCDPMLEKTGWLGDVNVALDSLCYNFAMDETLPDFLDVMRDGQTRFGIIPIMVPTPGWGVLNWIVWNSVYVFGIERLVNNFNRFDLVKEHYGEMRKYTLGHIKIAKDNGWCHLDDQLADWVAPMGGSDPTVQYDENSSEGCGIISTAFLHGVLSVMSEFAVRLGKTKDAKEYNVVADKVYTAFNDKFYNMELGIYETTIWTQIGTRTNYRQTSNLVPLAFGLVPKEHEKSVVDNIVADIMAKGNHLDTGCVGTKYILPILCEHGHAELAYKVATQTTYPSWGYFLSRPDAGSWEMWEDTARSFDHYFLGTYDEWFFSHLAGIRNIKEGYKEFTIDPIFYDELDFVEADIKTPRGMVRMKWERIDGEIKLEWTAPDECVVHTV